MEAGTSLSGLIQRLARAHDSALKAALEAEGLYPGQEQLLLRLAGGGPATPGEIAATLGIDASTATTSIKRLEKRGLLSRQKSDLDGRSFRIGLTREGGELADRLRLSCASLEDSIRAGLARRDLGEVFAVLQELTDASSNAAMKPATGHSKPSGTLRSA